jgi:hypothetical protein
MNITSKDWCYISFYILPIQEDLQDHQQQQVRCELDHEDFAGHGIKDDSEF